MKEERNVAFLKGTMALSVAVIITKVLGVAFKVPLSYVLGDEGMGYFNTAYAIYGLFYILCTAGVPKSLTLVLAENRNGKPSNDTDMEILKTGLSLFAKIGAFSTLLNIICAPVFADMVGNSKATLSIVAVAPALLFVSLSGVLRGYLNSSERLVTIAFSQLIEGAIKLVFGLLFAMLGVRNGASVSTVSALAILGITIGSALSYVYMFIATFYPNTDNKHRQKNNIEHRDVRRQILKNALPIALSSTLLNLSSTLDLTIIIKRLVGSGMSQEYANAIYGNYTTLAVPMFNLVIAVLAPIATSYMPRLSALHLKGYAANFTASLNKLLYVTLVISVPASLAFYFYSFDLLDVLFSVQSSALGAEMLIVLSLALCLLSSLTVVNTALESQGKMGGAVFSLLLGCAVKFAVSYVMIGADNVGILGAPIGTVVSYVISLAVSLLLLGRTGVRIYAVAKVIGIYMVAAVSFYPAYKLVYATSALGSSFISMIASLAISFVSYMLMLFALYVLLSKGRVFKMHKK